MHAYSGMVPDPFWWPGMAVLGLVVGLVAGLFGVGGGFLTIPAMNLLFGIPWEIAAGTGMCQLVGTAVTAYTRHRRHGRGEARIDWIMMGGGLLGVRAGAELVGWLSGLEQVALLGHRVPAAKLALSLVYVLVLATVAAWMIQDARTRREGVIPPPGPLTRVPLPPFTYLPSVNRSVSVPALAYLGLFLGLVWGMLGLGGAIVLLPILVYGIGMPIKKAVGTGLILLLASALLGTFSHAQFGHVDLPVALTLLVASTAGVPVGAMLTTRTPGHKLRGVFGGLLLFTAAVVLWDLVRVWGSR